MIDIERTRHIDRSSFYRWRKAWFAARTPTMLALVEQLRSYLGGGCECACMTCMSNAPKNIRETLLNNSFFLNLYCYDSIS